MNYSGQVAGQGSIGGGWTSSWYVGSGTPDAAFQGNGDKITISNTAGSDYELRRGFGDPTWYKDGDTLFFATELTKLTDNHENYDFGIRFHDGSGVVAGFGIADNKYYALLGNTRDDSGNVTAGVGEFGWVIGKIEFNVEGGSNERLSVWVNPTYSDLKNNTNIAGQVVADIGRTRLGNVVALTANVKEMGTLKAWDDLMIESHDHGLTLRVDIGSSSGAKQAGFEEWAVGNTPQASFQLDKTRGDYGFVPENTTLSFLVAAVDSEKNVEPFSLSISGGIAENLRKDGVKADGGVKLVLSGLPNDSVWIKSYHYHDGGAEEVAVYVTDDNARRLVGYFTVGTGSAPAEFYAAVSNAIGGGDITIEYVPRDGSGYVPLNGFFLVPEPTTYSLLATGAVVLVLFMRRRRPLAQP
jgi:hypothetical protein